MDGSFTLSGIPEPLRWRGEPVQWYVEEGSRLSVTAAQSTDWFFDPSGRTRKDDAPCALFAPPQSSFLLSARVAVGFSSTFDAGVLQLRLREDLWAKLCFEYSPQGRPMVVSVVTRGLSDDCNSAVVEAAEVYLRIAHTPQTTAFHFSADGRVWHLVRYFNLGESPQPPEGRDVDVAARPQRAVRPLVGFSAQAPTGRSCTAVFSEIRYGPGTLKDNRSGE